MSYYPLGTPFGPGIVVGQVLHGGIVVQGAGQVLPGGIVVQRTGHVLPGGMVVQSQPGFVVRQQHGYALQPMNQNALALQAYDGMLQGVADEQRKERKYQKLSRDKLQGQR